MTRKIAKVKYGRPYPKDWERKRLVMNELYKRGMRMSDLARTLKLCPSVITEVVWGIRISPKTEEAIASFFGLKREDLFPKRSRGRIAA